MKVRWLLDPTWHNPDGIAFCENIETYMAAARTVEALGAAAVKYRGRHALHTGRVLDRDVVIKHFKQPRWWTRLLPRRRDKAVRSFEVAQRLQGMGVKTPLALAAIEVLRGSRVTSSYYCCVDQPHAATMREAHRPDFGDRQRVIQAFGSYAADLHNRGIMHRDFTSGNILVIPTPAGPYEFSLVDLNRIRFGKVGRIAGILNLLQTGFSGDDAVALMNGYCAKREPKLDMANALHDYRILGCWHRLRWFVKNKTRKVRRKAGL
jgi:tRNA A-37 threonylcarbamoyl transferase component Bud32